MPTFCLQCGSPAPTDAAKFCNGCGAPIVPAQSGLLPPQPVYAQPSFSAMQRTESTIVQVAPPFENIKIQEMQLFGWNLQGRQEMHERGTAYGRPSTFGNTYIVETQVSQYVKLHFSRNMALPNLHQIKDLEARYFNLPFPGTPGFGCASVFTIFWLFGLPMFFIGPSNPVGSVFLVFMLGIGGAWIGINVKRGNDAKAICAQSARQAEEIKAVLRTLL